MQQEINELKTALTLRPRLIDLNEIVKCKQLSAGFSKFAFEKIETKKSK